MAAYGVAATTIGMFGLASYYFGNFSAYTLLGGMFDVANFTGIVLAAYFLSK